MVAAPALQHWLKLHSLFFLKGARFLENGPSQNLRQIPGPASLHPQTNQQFFPQVIFPLLFKALSFLFYYYFLLLGLSVIVFILVVHQALSFYSGWIFFIYFLICFGSFVLVSLEDKVAFTLHLPLVDWRWSEIMHMQTEMSYYLFGQFAKKTLKFWYQANTNWTMTIVMILMVFMLCGFATMFLL